MAVQLLNKLALLPDNRSYEVEDGNPDIGTKLGGGLSRIRKDYVNNPLRVDVEWTCDPEEYIYMQAFYRVIGNGTEPFLMDLIVHSNELEEHECRFVPNSFKLTAQLGNMYRLKATLEVRPRLFDYAYDQGIVTTYEAFGAEASFALQDIATLVNVTIPSAMQ